MNRIFDGVFVDRGDFFTRNMVPGRRVYGEDLARSQGIEYRRWDFTRSKPAAALKNGIRNFPLHEGMKILYLGVASGTTASHFSDIVGLEGMIYGVDISQRVLRQIIPIAEERGNIAPILGDTRKPEEYAGLILEKVDLVFEDVASDDQIPILIRNCDKFLRSGGFAMIAIKSQSIDVVKSPKEVYRECVGELEKNFEILEKVELDPHEKHHLMVVMRKK
ncbi:MAG: fibrillarin-like rRNA/tRNA 2'-O-methyltransferase [Candidatus Aenigmarchaeota archaeon]|nr:fibrillarin-like rRNA/tRNA 2'-O-methyltransferase [Candidatus Aenigmarchaeota archaeon]